MVKIEDPEGNETLTLHSMIDFSGHRVLEIGCGDGRLTWRYAEKAAKVTAIDPDGKAIGTAWENRGYSFKNRVYFLESTLEDFSKSYSEKKYDIVIFSWSL